MSPDLAGKDSWEQAQVDQYMELVEDMFKEFVKVFFEQDEAKKVRNNRNNNWNNSAIFFPEACRK